MGLAALALAAVVAAAPAAQPAIPAAPTAQPAIPAAPTRWVEDHAAMMSPAARDALDARLAGYERATGHQVVVWIGRTTGGAELADWAVRTFAAWQLGRKGIDDGVAIFVLADDRKIDIEVGYGLEDRIPDAIASRIIREVMAPRLRAGDRDGAVTAGAEAVLTAIEGKPWPGAPAGTGTASQDEGPSTISLVFGGLIGLVLLILFITHPRLALMLLWSVLRGGGGGFGGGGGDGGGFSGGGGRSGGGGARGGW